MTADRGREQSWRQTHTWQFLGSNMAGAAARTCDGGAVTKALITMARGTLVIMAIDQRSSLAVLTTATADLDTVAYEMTMLVQEAGSILRRKCSGLLIIFFRLFELIVFLVSPAQIEIHIFLVLCRGFVSYLLISLNGRTKIP